MGRRSTRRVGRRALIVRARDDDERAVTTRCRRRRAVREMRVNICVFCVVSMIARSSEVDDENDGWEERERVRVGFRGGVTDDG